MPIPRCIRRPYEPELEPECELRRGAHFGTSARARRVVALCVCCSVLMLMSVDEGSHEEMGRWADGQMAICQRWSCRQVVVLNPTLFPLGIMDCGMRYDETSKPPNHTIRSMTIVQIKNKYFIYCNVHIKPKQCPGASPKFGGGLRKIQSKQAREKIGRSKQTSTDRVKMVSIFSVEKKRSKKQMRA